MNQNLNTSANQPEIAKERNFEKLASILIASVTALAALFAFLQTYSGMKADEADRSAQNYSILATTTKVKGLLQQSYDWQGAFQTWYELDLQAISAEQIGNNTAANRFRTIQNSLARLSPLLSSNYFSENWPDELKYEAELYVIEATELSEKFSAESELSNAWESRANTFVILLTFTAVSLSLLGISTTVQTAWVRWLFVWLGIILSLGSIVITAITFFIPLPNTPNNAIEAFAQGVGLIHQGKNSESIKHFDEALAIKPEYANALYERGNANISLGKYTDAIKDYLSAQEAGRDDINVGWNLGWAYYLAGDLEGAVRTNQKTLLEDPSLIGLRMNQGLVLLAQGRLDNARIEYELAIDEAITQVSNARLENKEPPSSLWFYLDASVADLEGLLAALSGTSKNWNLAPPISAIKGDHGETIKEINLFIQRIKELSVGLEFAGLEPVELPNNPTTSLFQFAQEIFDENGEFLEYDIKTEFPYGTNEVYVLFDYSGILENQKEIWKIYRDGYEDPSLRVVSDWALATDGSAAKPITYAFSNVFIFTPGEYQVDLFIDSHLVGSGIFWVSNNSD